MRVYVVWHSSPIGNSHIIAVFGMEEAAAAFAARENQRRHGWDFPNVTVSICEMDNPDAGVTDFWLTEADGFTVRMDTPV